MGAWSEIKALHKKTTRGAKEGLAFRYFSRPLASFILYFIKEGRITPNQVTILSLLVGVAGSLCHMLILPYFGLLLGGALFMLAHVLDALDGQLARQRQAGSEVGMHFDFFIDGVKAYLMLVALTVRLYRQGGGHYAYDLLTPLVQRFGPSGVLYLGFLGLLGLSIGIACTQFLKLKSWKEAFPQTPQEGGASLSLLQRAVALAEKVGHFIVDYPSYILLLCILNRVDIYLVLYAAVVSLYSLKAMLHISLKLWRVNPYSET